MAATTRPEIQSRSEIKAVYKWDVSATPAPPASSWSESRSVSAGHNAGITRDTMFHRMTPEQWGAVINTNLFA
jgi:acetoacetyl-CoA reductase